MLLTQPPAGVINLAITCWENELQGDTDSFLQVNCVLVLLYHHESEKCKVVKGGKVVSFLQPMK